MTTVDAWAGAGAYFTWRGHRIFFRDEDGGGEPLLLIHGIPTASWDWHRVWPALAARYRVLAPDLIGLGLSDKPPRFPYGADSQADLCQALLAERGVTAPCHVLAQDDGATVVLELLARAREGRGPALASVCLLNGGVFPEAHRPLLMQRLVGHPLGRPLARILLRRPFQLSISRLFGPGTRPDAATLDALWQLVAHNRGARAMPRLMGYRADRSRHRDRRVAALESATVPCRFICGMGDPVCNEDMVALWRERVPGGDAVELPGIGHWPQLEAPDAVLAAYLEFRERIRR